MSNLAAFIDQVWTILQQDMNAGRTSYVAFPTLIRDIIGKKGMDIITARYRQLIQGYTVTTEDYVHQIIIMKPATNPNGSNIVSAVGSVSKDIVAKSSKLPRPPNAFILYRQHHHPLMKAEHPELHNTQISIILGTQWKNESEMTKAQFKAMAESLKKQHFRDHPEYVYQPRKPAEKKRRMTRGKIAAPAGSSISNSLPAFPKTDAGNVVLEIGNEHMEDGQFEEMLLEYNKHVTPIYNEPNKMPVVTYSPFLSSGISAEASEELNYYGSMVNYDQYDYNGADDLFNGVAGPSDMWDFASIKHGDAELARMSTVFEE